MLCVALYVWTCYVDLPADIPSDAPAPLSVTLCAGPAPMSVTLCAGPAGDALFSVRPAPAAPRWPAADRRSHRAAAVEPVSVSAAPAHRSFGRRGWRRLVTSCVPPADRRLPAAASGGIRSPLSPLIRPTVHPASQFSPAAPEYSQFSLTQSTAPQPDGVEPAPGEAPSLPEPPAVPRPPPVAHPVPWPAHVETSHSGRPLVTGEDAESGLSRDQSQAAPDCQIGGTASLGQRQVAHREGAEPVTGLTGRDTGMAGDPSDSGATVGCSVASHTGDVSQDTVRGFLPALSPQKLNNTRHSDRPFPTLSPLKLGTLTHSAGSWDEHKYPSLSPHRSDSFPLAGSYSPGRRGLPPPHPGISCRRALPQLPARQPPVQSACGAPVLSACSQTASPPAPSRGPAVLPSGGPTAEPPTAAAGANQTSYPYPCLLSSEWSSILKELIRS